MGDADRIGPARLAWCGACGYAVTPAEAVTARRDVTNGRVRA